MKYKNHTVTLLIPCHNEEATITKVINEFKDSMPELSIYVFDNSSTDLTAEKAKEAGAKVIEVKSKGKGNVVRRMFADIESDVYVMVDGDATYDAPSINLLVDKLIDENLDMVVGCRTVETDIAHKAYRPGHQWGNKMLTGSVTKIFGGVFTDMLSGYRAFSKRYVKSFPALSTGFETETELTVHALQLRMPYGEVMTNYGERPDGSESKLSTYKDGFIILKTIFKLFMREKPLAFFGIISCFLFLSSLALFLPIFSNYLSTGLVPRFPTAILSFILLLSSFLSITCGLIMDSITISRHESKRLFYMAVKK